LALCIARENAMSGNRRWFAMQSDGIGLTVMSKSFLPHQVDLTFFLLIGEFEIRILLRASSNGWMPRDCFPTLCNRSRFSFECSCFLFISAP
jgi:hypothetical protein